LLRIVDAEGVDEVEVAEGGPVVVGSGGGVERVVESAVPISPQEEGGVRVEQGLYLL
jgi:hypothetical protein